MHFGFKSELPAAVLRSPPTALQPQQLFFLRLRRAAARVTLFFLKSHFPYKTNEKSTLLVRKPSGGFKSELPTAVLRSPPHRAAATATFFSQIAQGCSHSNFFFSKCAGLQPQLKKAILLLPKRVWLLLAPPGCFWLLLVPSGCSWLLLASSGCFWFLLAAPGCY